MILVLIGILTFAAIVLVLHPMMARKREAFDPDAVFDLGDTQQLQYLNSKKHLILDNLRELDFEHEMGKLADEDYNGLREGYLREARDAIQALDQLKTREEIEQLIESDVRSRRRTE